MDIYKEEKESHSLSIIDIPIDFFVFATFSAVY